MKRRLIALTGRIGSGKSAVAAILRQLGYDTVDCDDLAKQVATQREIVDRVERLIGVESVENGQLNRKYIRETVFKDANLLKTYQQIFFDGVRALLVEKLATLQDAQAVFVEIPVLDAFEMDWDEVWRVEASQRLSVARVVARDGVSAESVTDTLARQSAYDCTRVIVNDGSLDELTAAVKNALASSGLD